MSKAPAVSKLFVVLYSVAAFNKRTPLVSYVTKPMPAPKFVLLLEVSPRP